MESGHDRHAAARGRGVKVIVPDLREFSRLANDEAIRKAQLRGLMKLRRCPSRSSLIRSSGHPDRPALHHRGDEPGCALPRGARDAAHRHEPARGQVQDRQGRRGCRPLDPGRQRRSTPLGDQADRLRPVWRDDRLLVNVDQLQIKIARSQAGGGGRSPGHKVDEEIAKIRSRRPGSARFAPSAPRHLLDRGSQAADLRPAPRQPRRLGLGQAGVRGGGRDRRAGVAKANADHVTISGHDGGTGASPQSSIQARASPGDRPGRDQQTLLLGDLRSRITVEVDGQMKNGATW